MATDGKAAGEGPYDVFISFARPGGRAFALELKAALAPTINAFVDERDTPLGSDWDDYILDSHQAAPLTVVVVSAHTRKSPHQKSEIQRAIKWSRRTTAPHHVIPWRTVGGPEDDLWPSGLSSFRAHIDDIEVPERAAASMAALLAPHIHRGPGSASSLPSATGGPSSAALDAIESEAVQQATRLVSAELTKHGRLVEFLSEALSKNRARPRVIVIGLLNEPIWDVLDALVEVYRTATPAERLSLREIASARLGVEGARSPAVGCIRAAVDARRTRPGRGELRGIAKPLTVGLANAASARQIPRLSLLPVQDVTEPAVEHTVIWGATAELPLVFTPEMSDLRAASVLGDEVDQHPTPIGLAGRDAIKLILKQRGAARACMFDAQVTAVLAALTNERRRGEPAQLLRIVVVTSDLLGLQAEYAYRDACSSFQKLFGDLSPPVFLLLHDDPKVSLSEHMLVDGLRALLVD